MSKRDKEKRRKGDGGEHASGAPRTGDQAALDSEAPPALDDAADAGASPSVKIPRLQPLDESSLAEPRSGPSYDFGDETFSDIAPVGPTEYAGGPPSIVPDAPSVDESVKPAPSMGQLEQQIRDLEARLDEMIDHGRETTSPPKARPSGAGLSAAQVVAMSAQAEATPARSPVEAWSPDATSGATAREILSSEFYRRQWGRAGMRQRAEEVDDFGHDPEYEARYRPFFDFLYKYYFRVEAEGTHHIPDEGRCLIVANHSGGPLPYDGLMLRTAVRHEHAQRRELRWLAEDFIYYLPFVGTVMNRLGAVRACQENAERLLAQGRLVSVFPEGAKGIGKLYRDRYRLQRFGRGGFIRLCLRTQTPIVPCAIIGAEEANPMLYRIEYMTKALGIPYLPITPTFPALGPLGLLPAPTKWKIAFGDLVRFDGYGPEAADDEILVGRLAERVRTTIQGMLDTTLSARKSIWFG